MAFFVLAFLYDTVIAVRGILCMYVRLLCTGVYSTNYIKKSEAFLQNKKELYAEGIEKQYKLFSLHDELIECIQNIVLKECKRYVN